MAVMRLPSAWYGGESGGAENLPGNGLHQAILVNDGAFRDADTLGTARVLAAAIEKMGDVQIAFFGKQAIDGDTGNAGQVAVKLGWTLTYVSAIKEIDAGGRTITVERQVSGAGTVTAPLPVVISVVKGSASRATPPSWASARRTGDDPSGRLTSAWTRRGSPVWTGPESTRCRRAMRRWR